MPPRDVAADASADGLSWSEMSTDRTDSLVVLAFYIPGGDRAVAAKFTVE